LVYERSLEKIYRQTYLLWEVKNIVSGDTAQVWILNGSYC
jgi:hypothetical protein